MFGCRSRLLLCTETAIPNGLLIANIELLKAFSMNFRERESVS